MKNLTNKYIIYMVLSIVMVSVVVVGVTYAFLMRESTQNELNVISTLSCINVDFADTGNAINLPAAYPLTHAEGQATSPYSFKLKSNCDGYFEYSLIAAVMNVDAKVADNRIKVAMSGGSTVSPILVSSLTKVDAGTKNIVNQKLSDVAEAYELVKGNITNKGEVSYNFRMWLDGETTSSPAWTDANLGKNYKVKLMVVAVAKNQP